MYIQVMKAYLELIRMESLKVSIMSCVKTLLTGMSSYDILLPCRLEKILQCWIHSFMPSFQRMGTKAYAIGTKRLDTLQHMPVILLRKSMRT